MIGGEEEKNFVPAELRLSIVEVSPIQRRKLKHIGINILMKTARQAQLNPVCRTLGYTLYPLIRVVIRHTFLQFVDLQQNLCLFTTIHLQHE